ncbi:MAG: metabolite traffic protein EboE [Bacteroidota bacterium]
MQISPDGHLCYCTNIHPGESWPEVLASLKTTLAVRDKFSPNRRFGIGLRLSAQAAAQLGTGEQLIAFRDWLADHNCYVFTMNGFPYGGFHGKVVKDEVHRPDWKTAGRLQYTKLLFEQLALLLPAGMDGGVSTSPVSYRHWFKDQDKIDRVLKRGAQQMGQVVVQLIQLRRDTGKTLHLDIEPEPDGLLNDTTDFLAFYDDYLLIHAAQVVARQLGVTQELAQDHVRSHLRLCYDICHASVSYEDQEGLLRELREREIRVGKLQISAALKAPLTDLTQRKRVRAALRPYHESTYLHQTVFRNGRGNTHQCADLDEGLDLLVRPEYRELRTHFHVPIFTNGYGVLQSTNDDIRKVLAHWKERPFTPHLEVETYTWDVLPDQSQLSLADSIHRELTWVIDQLAPTD